MIKQGLNNSDKNEIEDCNILSKEPPNDERNYNLKYVFTGFKIVKHVEFRVEFHFMIFRVKKILEKMVLFAEQKPCVNHIVTHMIGKS
uniref:Uncharacterized protein n=1 Tax=Romanomermis culicivorax TaxID=13658 RepID=A0A915J295_ROMCU